MLITYSIQKKKYIDNIQKEIDIMVLNKPKKYFKCTKK